MSVFEEIDLPKPLAEWLLKHGAVAPAELTAQPADPAAKQAAELLRLSHAAAARLRNGTVRAQRGRRGVGAGTKRGLRPGGARRRPQR